MQIDRRKLTKKTRGTTSEIRRAVMHKLRCNLKLAFCILQFVFCCSALAQEPAKVTYDDQVKPILRQHCFTCHGTEQKKSDLALDNYGTAMAGGASGEVLFAGDLDSSRLWTMVTHQETPSMPPGGEKLPQADLDVIKAWIEGGLLENSGSKAKPMKKSAVAEFKPTADNRPEGEPAMPVGIYREPIVVAEREGAVTALATSPWAPLAAVAGLRQVTLYHTDSAELLGVLPFLEGSPYVLRFSRDGSLLLAAGGRDASLGMVALYDVKSGRRLATIGDELDAVLAADLRADRSLVAVGGPRKIVRVYRVADGTLAYEITKHTDWVTALEFSPDGKFLVTGDRGGGLFLWDAATGRERGDLKGHTEQITAVSWRTDSSVIASASEDDTIKLWKTDAQPIKSWGAHGGGVLSAEFTRSGEIVSAGRDRVVKTWNAEGAAIRNVASTDDITLHARFTHDAKRVIAADWAGNVRVYEAETGAQAATLDPNPPTLDTRIAAKEADLARLKQSSQEAEQKLATTQQQLAAAETAEAQYKFQREAAQQAHTAAVEKRRLTADEVVKIVGAWRTAVDAANAAGTTLAQVETKVADARQALTAAQAAPAEKQVDVKSFADAVAKAEAELAAARGAKAAADKSLADAESQKTQADAQAAEATKGAELAQTAIAEVAARASQIPAITPLREAMDTAAKTHQSQTAELAHLEVQLAALVAERDAFLTAQQKLAEELAAVQEGVPAAESAVQAAASEHEKVKAQLAVQKTAIDELTAKLAELQKAIEPVAGEERGKAEQLAAKQAELEALKNRIADIEARRAELTAADELRKKYAAK